MPAPVSPSSRPRLAANRRLDAEADARLSPLLSPAVIEEAVAAVPDEFLEDLPPFATPGRPSTSVRHAPDRSNRCAAPGSHEAEEPCPLLTPSKGLIAHLRLRHHPRSAPRRTGGVRQRRHRPFSRPRSYLGVRTRLDAERLPRSGPSSTSRVCAVNSTSWKRSPPAIPPAAPSLTYPPPNASAGSKHQPAHRPSRACPRWPRRRP